MHRLIMLFPCRFHIVPLVGYPSHDSFPYNNTDTYLSHADINIGDIFSMRSIMLEIDIYIAHMCSRYDIVVVLIGKVDYVIIVIKYIICYIYYANHHMVYRIGVSN